MKKFIRIYNDRWNNTNRLSSLVHLLTACAVFGICCYVVKDGVFENYDSTKACLFACLMATIWIGIFNTVGLYSNEKTYTEDSFNKTLPLSVYMAGTMLNQFKLCLLQTLAVSAIFTYFFDYAEKGIVFSKYAIIDYGITFFLILFSSAMLGLVLGTLVNSINTVLTAIPIALIAQLLLSGCLFDLSGITNYISGFTTAKYGFCALGSIADLNGESLPLKINEYYPQVMKQANDLFDHTRNYVLDCWKHMFLLALIYFIISGISIYFTINRKK